MYFVTKFYFVNHMRLKLLLSLFFLFILGLTYTPSVLAQFENVDPQAKYYNTEPGVPQDFSTYTQSVFINIMATAGCHLTGVDVTKSDGKCLGVNPQTGKIGYVEGGGGLIGITSNMIASTFTIPVSGTHYGQYLADNFGVSKPAYADTDQPGDRTGFNGLMPILPLWTIFRNIVYLLFVLLFVLIGLGIMFRVKIDPRTVMTIQNQIPKVIIALILVTFSYAIAGFLIDLMYVMLYLIFNIFSSYLDVEKFNPARVQGANPITAVGFSMGLSMAWQASQGLGNIIGSLFQGTYGNLIAGVVGGILGAVAGGGIGSVFTGAIGFGVGFLGGTKLLGVVGGLIAFLVLAIAILQALFRLWIALLKAYIFILINTIFSPFWIAAGLVPGSSLNFGGWVRDMIGNLASFPATLFMLIMGKIFMDIYSKPSDMYFTPPFIGNPGDPNQLSALIGIGIILLTPNVVTIVRTTIKAPEGKLTSGVGQSFKQGAASLGALGGTLNSRLIPRNKQTGVADRGLVSDMLGRNRLTRVIFKVPHPNDRPPAAGNP